MRRGQIAPRPGRPLPYLRLYIGDRRPDRSADHQHITVRKRGIRRVPSAIVHVG